MPTTARASSSRDRPRPRHVSRHRHLARRADDRLRVRRLHVRRPARQPVAAVHLHRAARPARCWSTPRPISARRRLRFRLPRVDAILFTHSHADHVMGLDEVRRYNALQDGSIPCYRGPAHRRGDPAHLRLHLRVAHAARAAGCRSSSCSRSPASSASGARRSRPCRSGTDDGSILGYRIGPFAYLTDCNRRAGRGVAAARGRGPAGRRRAAAQGLTRRISR